MELAVRSIILPLAGSTRGWLILAASDWSSCPESLTPPGHPHGFQMDISKIHYCRFQDISKNISTAYTLYPRPDFFINFLSSNLSQLPLGVFTRLFFQSCPQQTPVDLGSFVLHHFLHKPSQIRFHPEWFSHYPQISPPKSLSLLLLLHLLIPPLSPILSPCLGFSSVLNAQILSDATIVSLTAPTPRDLSLFVWRVYQL